MGIKFYLVFTCFLLALAFWALDRDEYLREPEFHQQSAVEDWNEEELRGINQIKLHSKTHPDILFMKDTWGFWSMVEPERCLADQLKLHTIINALTRLRSERFIEFTEIYRQNEKINGTLVELSTTNKKLRANYFVLPSQKKNYYLHFLNQGNFFHKVITENTPPIGLEPDAYRSKKIIPFHPRSLKKIVYFDGLKKISIHEKNKIWQAGDQNSEMLPAWDKLLKVWLDAVCEGFSRDLPPHQVVAWYEFTFQNGKKAKLEMFVVKHSPWVAYTGQKISMKISSSTSEELFPRVSKIVKSL